MDAGISAIVVSAIASIATVIVGIRQHAAIKRIGGIEEQQESMETMIHKRLLKRMEDELMHITTEWKASRDEIDIKDVRIVWLQENLQKAKRDLAHFDRRNDQRDVQEAPNQR